MKTDIDKQIEHTEERLKKLKKRKADMKLKNENETLRKKLSDIENLSVKKLNFTNETGKKYSRNFFLFDDVMNIIKR